ncbi:MAG: hypothetical protein WCP21_11240, partial [Armatimonadota bacterium]
MTNLQYVGLAWVLVAIWYWSDTQQARAKGKKLPLVVHPLALLVLAARRLWQERAFVMVVLALLLVGSGLEYGVSRPLFYPRPVEPVLAPPVPTSGRSGPAIAAPPPVSRSARAGVRPFERPRPGLTEAVRLNLQRLREDGYPAWQAIQHGLPGKDSFPGALWRDPITSAALMLLAVMFLLRLRRAHPAWLGERAARQVRGVLITVVIGFVLQVLFTAWNMSVYNSLDTSGWLRYRLPFNIMATLVALVHCVAYGFVFACILQIARRGRCSYAAAIRTGLIVWLPMLAYFAVIRISTLVMQLLSSSILESVPYPLWIWLTSAISLVLMLVPWLRSSQLLGKYSLATGNNSYD